MDYAGALIYATHQYMKRDAAITEFIWTNIDLVEGHMLQLTNKDQSRTYASIFMHADRLYIAEATVPVSSFPRCASSSVIIAFPDGASTVTIHRPETAICAGC